MSRAAPGISGTVRGVKVVVAAAIVRGGKVLVQQRAWPEGVAGRWEFPGGRVDAGECEPYAVRRECAEELGVDVVPGVRVGPDVVVREGLVLRLWSGRLGDPGAEPWAVEHVGVAWVGAGDLDGVDWLEADRVLLPAVRELLGRSVSL